MISAAEALQIAELNGGRNARLANGNECNVYLMFPTGLQPGKWLVYYYANDAFTKLFEIFIDPVTGEFVIRRDYQHWG